MRRKAAGRVLVNLAGLVLFDQAGHRGLKLGTPPEHHGGVAPAGGKALVQDVPDEIIQCVIGDRVRVCIQIRAHVEHVTVNDKVRCQIRAGHHVPVIADFTRCVGDAQGIKGGLRDGAERTAIVAIVG